MSVTLVVGRTWDGALLPKPERAELRLSWVAAPAGGPPGLRVDVEAPYAGDPPPAGPPGPTDRLWEHEVVELFVVGDGERYLEIELGPHGHHLVLQLDGVRNVVASGLPAAWAPEIRGDRYVGTAVVDGALLPERPTRVNAFRIAGAGAARRYCAMVALPGPKPDFHQPARFAPWML